MSNTTPILVPLEPEQFWEKIREVVRSELAKHSKQQTISYDVPGMVQKPLYKPHEVCKMLTISRMTLHTWVKDGIIKQYKIKSRVYFLTSDIEKLVALDFKTPTPP